MSEGSILPASSIDRRLISLAAKHATPEEMSDGVLGKLTPAQAVDRVKSILSSKDVWTEMEERQLLMVQMQEHLAWLQKNRNNDKVLSSLPRMFKLIAEALDKSRINLDDVSGKLATEHANYFVSGFVLGFEKILKTLAEREDITIDEDDIQDLLEIGASASHDYVERVTIKNEE